jgi:hypothetical protein
MKYLEQRVEDLEKEVTLLKIELQKTTEVDQNSNTSSYLNNYPPYNNPNKQDYMYNHSNMTLLSESDLTKNPLDTIASTLNFALSDSEIHEEYPEYPSIVGSWDDGFNRNNEKSAITSLGFESEFDKQDKTFLKYLNSTEKTIEKEFGKIVSKFRILHHQWEMDGYGYIVNDNYMENVKNIIVTNHGRPIIVDKDYLNDIISGYKERIQETQRALFLVK